LLLRSLRCVGAVTIFADLSVLPTIRQVRPDIIAKGAEYGPEEVVGYECIGEWGGRIERLPMIEGVGTTAILERYRRAFAEGD
jgi:D-beta-D-heptose 7-phosphate kinase/D-beta-D-heptose 1-phosphate adenosyltransferase